MTTFWLIATIWQYLGVMLILVLKGEVQTANIGLLIFYALNFWGCRIVEILKEQKGNKNEQ